MLADFTFGGEGAAQLRPCTAGVDVTREAASMRMYIAHVTRGRPKRNLHMNIIIPRKPFRFFFFFSNKGYTASPNKHRTHADFLKARRELALRRDGTWKCAFCRLRRTHTMLNALHALKNSSQNKMCKSRRQEACHYPGSTKVAPPNTCRAISKFKIEVLTGH